VRDEGDEFIGKAFALADREKFRDTINTSCAALDPRFSEREAFGMKGAMLLGELLKRHRAASGTSQENFS